MKVLQVIPSVAPTYGGPSRAILDIERALAERGVEVTTVTTDDDGNGGCELSAEYGRPIQTQYATRLYFPRTLQFYTVSSALQGWLRANIRKYDLIHAHALFSFAPIAAAYYARKFGVPYVLRPLGVLAQYGMTQRRPWLKRMSLALIERRLLERASAIHFTSVSEKEEAELLGLHFRSAVIPLGIQIDESAFQQGETREDDQNSFTLLFLSRLDPKKNIEGLLHAVALLAEKYPRLMLQVAGTGEGEYPAELHALAARLHLNDRVTWLGFIQGERKIDLFRKAKTFVLPSFSENFGIAAVEALAEGLPCIVSRHIAISSEIEASGAGILVDTNPESIAAGIEAMMARAGNMPAMRAAARRLVREEFSLESMGERLLSLYRDILHPRSITPTSLLDQITPMILTFNEEPNIERTISKLTWAERILIIDSGSTDRTLEIAKRYPQVVVLHRKFDTAAMQCNFGLRHVDTEWVLSMDADYVLSDALIEELRNVRPAPNIRGFAVRFHYKVFGRPLRGSLYPDRVMLYRRDDAIYRDEGHTQRVSINGQISRLRSVVYHDDRKPIDRWFSSQARYARLEAERLTSLQRSRLDRMDRLRLMIVPAPIIALFYALIRQGGLLDGWPGWYYALQRLCAEVMLSIELLDRRLSRRNCARTPVTSADSEVSSSRINYADNAGACKVEPRFPKVISN